MGFLWKEDGDEDGDGDEDEDEGERKHTISKNKEETSLEKPTIRTGRKPANQPGAISAETVGR